MGGAGGPGRVAAQEPAAPSRRPWWSPSFRTDPPSPRERLAALPVDQVVERGYLLDVGSVGDRTLTVWLLCTRDTTSCRSAWRLLRGAEVVATGRAVAGAPGPGVTASARGFVLDGPYQQPLVVGLDGTATHAALGGPQPVTAGDVAEDGDAGWLVVDPAQARAWRLASPAGTEGVAQAVAAADGTLWALPGFAGPGRVEVARLRGGAWTSHRVEDPASGTETPGYLAVGGDHVATFTSHDGAGELPLGVFAVTTDGGSGWTALRRDQVPFDLVGSMAATSGGTLFVAHPDGRVWRSTDATWTRFAPVTGIGQAGALRASGDVVLARAEGTDRVLRLADDGSATPLPRLR